MIALGNDHAGYALKQEIIAYLEKRGLAYGYVLKGKAPPGGRKTDNGGKDGSGERIYRGIYEAYACTDERN